MIDDLEFNDASFILLAKDLISKGVLRFEEECEDYSPYPDSFYKYILAVRYLPEGCQFVERRGPLLVITEEVLGMYDPVFDLIQVRVQSPDDSGPNYRYHDLTHEESGDYVVHDDEKKSLIQLALMLEFGLSDSQKKTIARNFLDEC